MDDLISEFIEETTESLAEIDNDLVTLEQNPNDQEILGNVFRLMHTVKGTCGFLGLPRLETVAHHAENVLGRFRDGDLDVTADYMTLIFQSVDRIRHIVEVIAETGAEPEGDDSELIEQLDAVYEGKDSNATTAEEDAPAPANTAIAEDEFGFEVITAFADEDDNTADNTAETQEAQETKQPEDKPEEAKTASAPVTAQTLRVNVDVLENLMTMVSELVLTRNQLLQILRVQNDSDFGAPLQRLNHVVSDLQEGVMKTRMQPIGNAWSKLPRIIRDISMELGKKIDLQMHGQDTELDRQVLEMIRDPLTHMIRNSGDHGIETPEERLAAGKPETGNITLEAFHEGGHIIIRIKDDGKGLAVDKLRDKAIKNNLATEEELAEMSDNQIQQFIFHPGFSTAEAVTSISGRGVGMDVVRTNIEKIGGNIELQSTEGIGTTFTIKIPLTLAIVSALIVENAGERFAIPQLSVRELVMVSETGEHHVEMIKGTPVLRLRDHLLPLVKLNDLMNLAQSEAEQGAEEQSSQNKEYVVVTQVGAYTFGIVVDRVFDTEEIVVKPVAPILSDIDIFSGNTILGDGTVIMILDPNGIANATGDISVGSSDANTVEQAAQQQETDKDKISMLLVRAGDNNAPKAVPLSLIARLEDIKLSDVEISGNRRMIQYRGSLMPLVPFSDNFDWGKKGVLPVLVFSDATAERDMGLIVDEIIDIVDDTIDIKLTSDSDGMLGSAIINGATTDIIDIGHYLQKAFSDWFKNHDNTPFETGETDMQEQKRRVLLVDDSPFFRNMLTPLLSVAGYDVTTAETPMEALEICESGQDFDIIVSDIEMPEMDGFEFAKKIKSHEKWQHTPLLALSSHATPQDMKRGKDVGFNNYIAKFDRDTLLNALSETLAMAGE